MRSIEFGFPQGLKQVVPEMKSDLYRPKIFFGVQFRGPLRVVGHREHQVLVGVAWLFFIGQDLLDFTGKVWDIHW